jgi:hypothetical protein
VRKRASLTAGLAAALALLSGVPVQAAPTKVWVATGGTDSTTCGAISSPCASLQRAHDNVAAGGEIGVLTPGDYGGGLLITKSVSITNDGAGEATIGPGTGLNAATSIGIDVEAGPGDIISIRGLVLDGGVDPNGSASNQNGITFGRDLTDGAALHIQNCVIRNFQRGIVFAPSSSQQLFVSDTIIFNNGTQNRDAGIVVAAGEGNNNDAKMVLDRVHLENNFEGLLIENDLGFNGGAAGVHITVRDSVISGNVANGVHALTATGHPPAFAVVERTSIVNNRQNGILADGPRATILLSDSTVARNAVGISTINGGQLVSYRNNRINNNIGPDGAPTGFDARQ